MTSKNKPAPKGHLLHHASKELIAAVDFYTKMHDNQLASDFATFDSHWREFLQKIERTWNKTEAGVSDRNDCKLILDQTRNLRKTDDLLVYLRHARNTDEHANHDIARDWVGDLRASPAEPTGIRIEWNPWDRHLLPVMNRGVVYQPARVHLGVSFADQLGKGVAEPVIVGDLALQFYLKTLQRLEAQIYGTRQPIQS